MFEKMTKKDFLASRKNLPMKLVKMCWNKTKEDVAQVLSKIHDINQLPKIPLSSVNVDDQGEYKIVRVYTSIINEIEYIFIEEHIDNSKCNHCSWDTKEVHTLLYVLDRQPITQS